MWGVHAFLCGPWKSTDLEDILSFSFSSPWLEDALSRGSMWKGSASEALGVSFLSLHLLPENLWTFGFSVTPTLVYYTHSHIRREFCSFAFSSFVGLGGEVGAEHQLLLTL